MRQVLQISFFLLSLLFLGIDTFAQTIHVKSSATGANNGTSWADAYTNLTTALTEAPAGAEIWVAAGTYKPSANTSPASNSFSITKNLKLYGGFAGNETMLSQRNPTTNVTILSGDMSGNDISNDFTTNRTDNVYHVVTVAAPGVTITFDGFAVRGGNAPQVPSGISNDNRGGGLFASSPVRIANCIFSDNSASAGGAVSIAGIDASNSSVENCIFEKNNTNLQSTGLHMEQLDGGSVRKTIFRNSAGVRGAMHLRTSTAIIIDSCSFIANTSSAIAGGFYSLNSSYEMSNSTFTDNVASNGGGGMYNEHGTGTNYFISINKCTFTGNRVNAGTNRGGAISNFRAKIQVSNCKFKDNMATGSGGTLNNTNSTNYTYTDCEFEGSSGNFGGVATNYNDTNGSYNNCKFRGNRSNSGGGALSYGFKAQGTINNCTFEDNTANTIGGAVYVQNDSTSVSINQCYFSGNKGTNLGGALFLRAGSNTNVSKCDFLGNTSTRGGAVNIQVDSIQRPILNVERSTFFINIADEQGGAFNISNANVVLTNSVVGGNTNLGTAGGGFSNNASRGLESTLRLVNSTVASNTASVGAGVANWQEDSTSSRAILSILNSIFENNGANYEIEDGSPTVLSSGGNHSSDASFGSSLNGPQDASGVSAQFVDPGFDDYHLRPTSPCVNTALVAGAPQYDLEGGLRDAMPDKGAYELNSVGTFYPANDFDFSIMPNPIASWLRIQLPDHLAGMAHIRVFDATGALVLEQEYDNHGQVWVSSLAELHSGTYQVRIEVAGQQAMKTVVKL